MEILKYFKIFTSNEKIPLLGRWCHVNILIVIIMLY